ncbi:hypothetical protein [Egbenema bharatensis]|uniref:hypothetical protein n=1 Tax=Egbenema bharatensis TaxID=3463334 RepID=UPI003A8BBA83
MISKPVAASARIDKQGKQSLSYWIEKSLEGQFSQSLLGLQIGCWQNLPLRMTLDG